MRFCRKPENVIEITVFLYVTIFLTTRFGTFIHEFLGHGLAATLVGGKVTGVSVSFFATGYCGYELPEEGVIQRAFVGLAGIVANLFMGMVALMITKHKRLPWEVRAILCVFAIVSIGSQLVYLVMGTYYGHGDPVIFKELLGSASWLIWALALVVIAPSTYLLLTAYLELQEDWAACDSLKTRFTMLLSTLVVASLIYGVCFWIEEGTTAFLGGMAASEQEITETAQKAVDREGLEEQEKASRIEAIKKQLRPFPIIVPLLLLVFVSGVMAFLKTRHWPTPELVHGFRTTYLWVNLFLSLLVVGAIALS